MYLRMYIRSEIHSWISNKRTCDQSANAGKSGTKQYDRISIIWQCNKPCKQGNSSLGENPLRIQVENYPGSFTLLNAVVSEFPGIPPWPLHMAIDHTQPTRVFLCPLNCRTLHFPPISRSVSWLFMVCICVPEWVLPQTLLKLLLLFFFYLQI